MTEEYLFKYMHDVEAYFQEMGIEVLNSEYNTFPGTYYYIKFTMADYIYFFIYKSVDETFGNDDNFLVDYWTLRDNHVSDYSGLLQDLIIEWK